MNIRLVQELPLFLTHQDKRQNSGQEQKLQRLAQPEGRGAEAEREKHS